MQSFGTFKRQNSLSSHITNAQSNSNLIWLTVSCRVDEVIPSGHPGREASKGIQYYDHYPLDVILYVRSSYYYNYMFNIPFSFIILILKIVLVFNPEKLRERLSLRFVS